jgi:glucose/arabinose dehydrogenase
MRRNLLYVARGTGLGTRMRYLRIALLLLVVPSATHAGTPIAGFSDTAVISSLSSPTALAFLPDGRMLVTLKGGDLLRVDAGVATTLTTIPVCSDVEMGLLGVAVDPNFTTNGFVYLYRTKAGPSGCGSNTGRFNQVVRVTVSGNTAGSLVELLDGIQTDNGNHDGGGLRIGPDGKLYVGAGDTGLGDNQGGPGSSTNPYSQDLAHLEGKVLRLNLDGTIPADNPFVGNASARHEIFAYGFRNPFRFGFDPTTNALWLGDVGDLAFEELDIVVSGGNYAWPHCEGTQPTSCEQPGDIDPIFTYPHSGATTLGATVIGGAFAPAGFGGLDGDYFFADFIADAIYHALPNGPRDGVTGTPDTFVSAAGGGFADPSTSSSVPTARSTTCSTTRARYGVSRPRSRAAKSSSRESGSFSRRSSPTRPRNASPSSRRMRRSTSAPATAAATIRRSPAARSGSWGRASTTPIRCPRRTGSTSATRARGVDTSTRTRT